MFKYGLILMCCIPLLLQEPETRARGLPAVGMASSTPSASPAASSTPPMRPFLCRIWNLFPAALYVPQSGGTWVETLPKISVNVAKSDRVTAPSWFRSEH